MQVKEIAKKTGSKIHSAIAEIKTFSARNGYELSPCPRVSSDEVPKEVAEAFLAYKQPTITVPALSGETEAPETQETEEIEADPVNPIEPEEIAHLVEMMSILDVAEHLDVPTETVVHSWNEWGVPPAVTNENDLIPAEEAISFVESSRALKGGVIEAIGKTPHESDPAIVLSPGQITELGCNGQSETLQRIQQILWGEEFQQEVRLGMIAARRRAFARRLGERAAEEFDLKDRAIATKRNIAQLETSTRHLEDAIAEMDRKRLERLQAEQKAQQGEEKTYILAMLIQAHEGKPIAPPSDPALMHLYVAYFSQTIDQHPLWVEVCRLFDFWKRTKDTGFFDQ